MLAKWGKNYHTNGSVLAWRWSPEDQDVGKCSFMHMFQEHQCVTVLVIIGSLICCKLSLSDLIILKVTNRDYRDIILVTVASSPQNTWHLALYMPNTWTVSYHIRERCGTSAFSAVCSRAAWHSQVGVVHVSLREGFLRCVWFLQSMTLNSINWNIELKNIMPQLIFSNTWYQSENSKDYLQYSLQPCVKAVA